MLLPNKIQQRTCHVSGFWLLTLLRMGLLGAAQGWEGGAKSLPLPKIYHTYPTMIKLGTLIP